MLCARVKRADGDHRRVQRGDLAADEGLERTDDVGAHQHRILADMG